MAYIGYDQIWIEAMQEEKHPCTLSFTMHYVEGPWGDNRVCLCILMCGVYYYNVCMYVYISRVCVLYCTCIIE